MSRQEVSEAMESIRSHKENNGGGGLTRALLAPMLENLLTNVTKVAESVQRGATDRTIFNILKFFQMYIKEAPSVFLSCNDRGDTTPTLSELENSTTNEEEVLSQAFNKWCLSKILWILCQKSCSPVHEKCIEVISDFLQLIKSRDFFYFNNLVQLIQSAVVELVQINEELYSGRSGSVLTMFLNDLDIVHKSLKDKKDTRISAPDFNINSIELCETVQLNLTKILQMFASEICSSASVNVLWGCMCWYMDQGDLDIKVESLKVVKTFMKRRGLPPMNILSYFCGIIASLLELLISGCKGADSSDIEDIENETAHSIDALLSADQQQSELSHLSPSQLQEILSRVQVAITTYGLGKLKTKLLASAISDLVTYVFERSLVGDATLLDMGYLRESVTMTLLALAGKEAECQIIIKPLTKILWCEVLSQASTASIGKKGEMIKTASLSQMSRKRKAEPEKESLKMKIEVHRRVVCRLNDLLTVLTQKEISQDTTYLLEGIWSLTEVLLLTYGEIQTKKKEILPLLEWLPADTFKKTISSWEWVLQSLQNDLWLRPCVNTIIKSVLGLLSSQANLILSDWSSFLQTHLTMFGWILSLPWLQNDPSWKDLKPQNGRDVAKISQMLSDHLDEETKCLCIHGLALLSKDTAPNWRIHVYKQVMTDSCIPVRLSGVQYFPLLLQQMGPNANHLVHDLLIPLVEDNSPDIQCCIAEASGILSCVVSRKAMIIWKEKGEDRMEHALEMKCLSCDNIQGSTLSSTTKDRPKLVDPNMFSAFLGIINSDNTKAKHNLIQSMRRIFGHIGIRSNNVATLQMLTNSLSLMEDQEYSVRFKFSKIVKFLVGEGADTNLIFMNKLRDITAKASADQTAKNTRLLETTVMATAQIGCVADSSLLMVAVEFLLSHMMSSVPSVAFRAYEQLSMLSKFRKKKGEDVFMESRREISQFVVDYMHHAEINQCGKKAKDILKEMAEALGYPKTEAFLQVSTKFMIPQLALKGTPQASVLIKMIATLLQEKYKSRTNMLIEHFKYIFSYLVRFSQGDSYEKEITMVNNFLKRETEYESSEIGRLKNQENLQELLLHLSTHYKRVFMGIQQLALWKKSKVDLSTTEKMADYLQPHLLGVITYFDSNLMNSENPKSLKKLILESLTALIKLMGKKHISRIRQRVYSTLKIGLELKDPDFNETNCKAWDCFVRSLETPLLGQMMPQIVAALLPLLKDMPKGVADIFNFIILEHRESLAGSLHEVYFLPDIPELAEAHTVLKQCTEQGPSSHCDLKSKLRDAMKGIQHECLDIRLHALSKLRKLLREEKEKFYDYVMGNETADRIVTELVSVLLKGCRETDSRAQCLYAECIGEVGAIDPGRLELMTNNPKEHLAKFQISIEDDSFALGVISEGVKAYLTASEGIVQDCAALALQELLKIYRVPHPQGTNKDPSGKKIWDRLDEQAQQILLPFFQSRYMYKEKSPWDYSKLKKPLYCSEEKYRRYSQWVCKWTGYLSSKVKKEKPGLVFRACEAVVLNNLHMALYIQPFIVFQIVVDSKQEDREEIFTEINEVLNQTVKSEGKSRTGSSNAHHLATQTICTVIDYLERWRQYKAQNTPPLPSKPREPAYLADAGYKAVDSFLQRVPHYQIANACFKCKAFTRSLMNIELHLQDKKQNLQDHLDFIQRLYQALDEPDGVVGVSAIRRTPPSLMEQILIHESLGQHEDAQSCYEKAIQTEPDEVSYHQGLLYSLMELGQVNKALLHATGAVAKKVDWNPQLYNYMVEAAWKLGRWQELENFVKSDKQSRTWAVGVGKVLMAAKEKKEDVFMQHLQILRQEQMGPLSAASMESGSYLRGYQYIVRLHMINEIEESLRLLLNLQTHTEDGEKLTCATSIEQMIKHWETRIQITQCSFRTEEPVLTLRRALFTLAQKVSDQRLDHEIGHWWLVSAKIAREAGYIQTAYSALLQALDYKLPEGFIEEAKWLWHKGSKDEAITTLERGMAIHFPDADKLKEDLSHQTLSRRKVYAEALLLYGRYSDETCNLESNAILKRYKEVTDIYNDYEDGHFYMANYYDKIMTMLLEDKAGPDPSKQGEFVIHVVKHFGSSLLYGNHFIYQSLPRLLSLWLDYGSGVVEMEKREKQQNTRQPRLPLMRNVLVKLNKIVDNLCRQLAPYQLYTAFSQLVSRICHTQPDVFQKLKEIIARIFVHFPQQALWNMMAVSKSSYQVRVNRCKDIFATATEIDSSLHKFIQDATKLAERLLELCEREERSSSMSMSQHFKPLKRLLENSNFSRILLPLTSAMTVTLPTTPGSHRDHNPFPSNQVYLHGFEDTIEIMPSLQKPKKITMIGSDGHFYVMMCKPKDDLRKDCRLMEFNAIVNKFLNKDPESRKRELHIRTYSVIPLNEECGLIEWVNNTHGLRNILLKLYKERGKFTSGRELQSMAPNLSSSIDVKMQIYKEKFLPRHPPVFKEWFYRTFPDPTAWYNARLAYARTLAVMSMVGYILGLGDRHGENILFDSTCGDCVHVDLNCLFNKGETFEWPERVPFRLTHNMVDALGPMGIEGIYRRACEVTLRVMRNQNDPLMSVLKPLVYDPLVEWSRGQKGQKATPGDDKSKGEITNDQAMTHVQNIEHRLKGILKSSRQSKPRSIPLSIEGHVRHLIQEASDDRNLCQMYVGWAAFM